jgi:hypothetical protein
VNRAVFAPSWVVMSDSAVPKTWEDARNLVLGNSPWILLLVVVERAVEGHFVQAGGALIGCFISLGVAIYWKAFEGLTKPEGRRRLSFVFITVGAAILATGIYMLANQRATPADNGQLHVAKQEVAPAPPPPSPPSGPASHSLTQKEEEALQGLSAILNGKGGAVLKLAEKPVMRLNTVIGFENAAPVQIRDSFQEIVNALSSMETALYREFLPSNRYYKAELLAALGATSDSVVESPVYKYGQFVGSFTAGTLNTIMTVSDEVKNPQITNQMMTFAYQRYQEFQEKNTAFKNWIDECNARIEQRKAQK